MKLSDDIKLIGIRVLAIMYITVLYVIFGVYITYLLDEYGYHDIFVNSENDNSDSIFVLIFELSIMFGILAVIAFIGRNLIQLIPFPFDGIFGFDYESVREVTSGAILFIIMVNFSAMIQTKITNLQDKLNIIKKRKYNHIVYMPNKN